MSDSSGNEFDGFSIEEVNLAAERYRQILLRAGIGDDLGISDVESENSDENGDDPPVANVNNAGDAPGNGGWHSNFNYFERGLPHLFTPRQNTGPQTILGPEKEPIDFFKLMFTDNTLEYIIHQTDTYARKQIEEHPEQNKSAWSCPSIPEMRAFLGLTFLMGITVKPDIRSYWSTDIALETPFFSKTMSRDRFHQIMRYLHFNDPNQHVPQAGEPNRDCLYKVRTIMNMFNEQMKSQYVPKRQVSVDETMIPFKGRVSFKQYMPAKPSKWGIKMWALSESDTGYMSFCEIYSGKKDRPVQGLASNVVKGCLEGSNLVGQGYHIYMDNFFTSPDLFTDLFENFDTRACGTVRRNRRGLPKDIMKKKPDGINERGDSHFRQKGPISAVVWKDKKIVSAISTIHDNSSTEVERSVQVEGQFTRQQIPCPQLIADYTSYMGGVDKCDQYIQYYVFNHKTLKWPKRIFFKMLEILKYNSFRLFLLSPNHQPAPSKSPLTFLQFSQSVAMGLINGYTTRENPRGRPSTVPLEIRLTQRHLPADLVNKSWCHVCYARYASGKQEKKCQTRYGCSDCRKHLCLPKCFAMYHSVKNYC